MPVITEYLQLPQIERGIDWGPYDFQIQQEVEGGPPVNMPLSGCMAYAEIRESATAKEVIVDLKPFVFDVINSKIRIPKITGKVTQDFRVGDFYWDFIIRNASGEFLGCFMAGPVKIKPLVTRPR